MFTRCSLVLILFAVPQRIVFGSPEINYFESFYEEPQQTGRNAIKLEQYKWPNGIVPYIFHREYTAKEQIVIIQAMEIFTAKTCVQFIPKTDEHVEHIQFVKGYGCRSLIGYRRGQSTPLNVTYSEHCLTVPGAMQHEMLHVLGLLHEQSRPDRDDYITVVWQNIELKSFGNFRKASNSVADTFNLPYDFDSLMHYPKHAFARPGTNLTMYATKTPSRELGQSIGPTFYDLEKIRKMYKC